MTVLSKNYGEEKGFMKSYNFGNITGRSVIVGILTLIVIAVFILGYGSRRQAMNQSFVSASQRGEVSGKTSGTSLE